MYIASELLRTEGFTDVRYIDGKAGTDSTEWIARGELDFDLNYGPTHITSIAAGVQPMKDFNANSSKPSHLPGRSVSSWRAQIGVSRSLSTN
jgi:hypothetical protein